MLDEMKDATTVYLKKWDDLIAKRKDKDFFHKLKPTSIAWKTTDISEFNNIFLSLRGLCDQIHLGWVHERWLASLHLKNINMPGNIKVIKLMQRRPTSTDAVGLDHLDFYFPSEEKIKSVLANEPLIKWTKEISNPYCNWYSIWFDHTEAKLRNNTVLEVCIAELEDTNEPIINT